MVLAWSTLDVQLAETFTNITPLRLLELGLIRVDPVAIVMLFINQFITIEPSEIVWRALYWLNSHLRDSVTVSNRNEF